ncbi:MAG: DUF547 domain-containing protein [Geminicoccaceae bacterium]
MFRFFAPLLIVLLVAAPAVAAPKAELWPRWQQHEPSATQVVDHQGWARFLASYLRPGADGVNRVAYAEVDAAARAGLGAYVATMGQVAVSSLNRAEQMAYWINLYNALTVHVVLEHYPVASIRDIDISPGLLSHGPWGAKLVTVEGQNLALDDIEHRILRPIWHDPRVHYALNCAALGCPNLRPTPYTAATLDRDLDEAAITYVNDPRGARLERDGLHVSSIYIWFEDDFGGDDVGVIRHLMAYADPALAMRLQALDGIAGHGYDWSLNDAAPTSR